MKIEIKQEAQKTNAFFVRVDEALFNRVEVLRKEKKVERAFLVRKLIELGLESLK